MEDPVSLEEAQGTSDCSGLSEATWERWATRKSILKTESRNLLALQNRPMNRTERNKNMKAQKLQKFPLVDIMPESRLIYSKQRRVLSKLNLSLYIKIINGAIMYQSIKYVKNHC